MYTLGQVKEMHWRLFRENVNQRTRELASRPDWLTDEIITVLAGHDMVTRRDPVILVNTPRELRKFGYQIDGGGIVLEGYTDGRRWNGWECPYFTRAELLRWLKSMDGNGVEGIEQDGDLIIARMMGERDPWQFTKGRYDTTDGELELYSADGFCFDEVPMHGYYYQFRQNDAVSRKYGPYASPIYIKGGELRCDEFDCPISVYFENSEQWIEGTDDSDAWDIVMIWYE